MRRLTHGVLMCAALASAAACGGPPRKSTEMVEYEAMRANTEAETVKERYPDLAREATAAYRSAEEALSEGEAEWVLHHTRVATLKWRSAVELTRAQDAHDSAVAAENRVKIAEDELKDAQRRHQVSVEGLEQARRIKALEAQVIRDEKAKRVNAVSQRMQEAMAYDAARHAPDALAKAQASLQAAQGAFNAGKLKDSDRLAESADADVLAVIAIAKPLFEAEKKERDLDARLRALLEQSAQVPGARGSIVQRGFVLTLRGTFAPGQADIAPDQMFAVDRVVELVKAFGEFKVAIEGHTDNQGRKDANMTMSQGRAQAVLSYLASKDVDVSRLSALGKGDAEPVADNRTKEGRERNRRVDVVFLR